MHHLKEHRYLRRFRQHIRRKHRYLRSFLHVRTKPSSLGNGQKHCKNQCFCPTKTAKTANSSEITKTASPASRQDTSKKDTSQNRKSKTKSQKTQVLKSGVATYRKLRVLAKKWPPLPGINLYLTVVYAIRSTFGAGGFFGMHSTLHVDGTSRLPEEAWTSVFATPLIAASAQGLVIVKLTTTSDLAWAPFTNIRNPWADGSGSVDVHTNVFIRSSLHSIVVFYNFLWLPCGHFRYPKIVITYMCTVHI